MKYSETVERFVQVWHEWMLYNKIALCCEKTNEERYNAIVNCEKLIDEKYKLIELLNINYEQERN